MLTRVHFFVRDNLILVLKKLHQRPFSSSNMSHLRMSRISFDQARAIAIQSAILYHTRTAKQILVEGTLEGINEAKCTQLLRMSLYRCCIHRENVSHCNWKKQYFRLKKLIHVLLTTCRLRIYFLLCATHLYRSKAKHRSFIFIYWYLWFIRIRTWYISILWPWWDPCSSKSRMK